MGSWKKEDTQCLLPPEELIFPEVSLGPQLLEGELGALAQEQVLVVHRDLLPPCSTRQRLRHNLGLGDVGHVVPGREREERARVGGFIPGQSWFSHSGTLKGPPNHLHFFSSSTGLRISIILTLKQGNKAPKNSIQFNYSCDSGNVSGHLVCPSASQMRHSYGDVMLAEGKQQQNNPNMSFEIHQIQSL